MPDSAIASYWFGRFQVLKKKEHSWYFRDWLQPLGRELPTSVFDQSVGNQREQVIAFFQQGFLQGAISSAFDNVQSIPRDTEDTLFWQFPCRTEAAAWDAHSDLENPLLQYTDMHMYLGLPWATWIDFQQQRAWSENGRKKMEQQLRLIRVRLSGIRGALTELGVRLRVHTVCQHIYWRNFLSEWQSLGVTDLWLSHCPLDLDLHDPINLHPWHLYAVNVEDVERRAGLQIGKDVAEKTVLASFVGAHMPHYLSDIRLRLKLFANEKDFVVQVTEKWHFEDVVYQHQMGSKPLQETYQIDNSVAAYNALLSDSVFSLCPAGAGPNTLRLWESLAVGSIPVLLGDEVCLPNGGNLPMINWDDIVLRISDQQLASLPQILRSISLEERRRRQQRGMNVYQQVRKQRCF